MNRGYRSICLALFAYLVLGCATVPDEVVTLSSKVGTDIESLQVSYNALIRSHFDGLRRQVDSFINLKWRPAFLKSFVAEGQLAERAGQQDHEAVLTDVSAWAEKAVERIEEKRRMLLDPIDADENELQASVDLAFMNILRAQAMVTAYLESLRDIDAAQKQVLEDLKLEELREKITKGLSTASEKTAEAIKGVEMASDMVKKAETIKKKRSE